MAVRPGFAAGRLMGSAATDLRARLGGIGGRRLERADVLGYAQAPLAVPAVRIAPWSTRFAQPPEALPWLGLIPGPAWPALSLGDRERIAGEAFTVSRAADRMGLSLEQSLESAATLAPILSQGWCSARCNCRPTDTRSCRAERQTTGGYPLLGVVAARELHAALAQLKPGDALRLRLTDVAAAQAAWRARELGFRRWRIAVRAWWESLRGVVRSALRARAIVPILRASVLAVLESACAPRSTSTPTSASQ